MRSDRKQILDWAEHGQLGEGSLCDALKLTEADPAPNDWRCFLDRLMLWLGSIFMAVGVIFFFAYNWQEMGRYAKFGLVEILILITVGICWKIGLDRLSGKATLFSATLLIGALLALVGQTYQTGADPWQLFASWALMILPWVVIARFGGLLLFWVGLVNLSMLLYFQTFPRFFGFFGLLFGSETLLWTFFIFNTVILCLWEFAAQRGVVCLNERWALRVLAFASGSLITTLAVWSIVEFRSFGIAGPLVYCVWLAAAYALYRHKFQDIFVLAGGVLSTIIVVTTGLVRMMILNSFSAGGLLFLGMAVIGMSAAGGYWLKALAQEETS